MSDAALIAGHGGWFCTPECAAVHPVEHFFRRSSPTFISATNGPGAPAAICLLAAHSLAETLARLTRLLDRINIDRLIVAGDLVESPRPCVRTARDVAALKKWLAERDVELVVLAGNHDPIRRPPLPEMIEVAGWTVCHGHRSIQAPRSLCGHHHPHLRAPGVSAPCFLVGRTSVVLPAFSRNAAGVSLSALPPWLLEGRRCIAVADKFLLDFGSAPELMKGLRSA